MEINLSENVSGSFFDIIDSNNSRSAQGNLGMVNGVANTWYHIKIACSNGNITLYNLDNSQSRTISTNVSYYQFRFLRYNGVTRTMLVREFKIYPI